MLIVERKFGIFKIVNIFFVEEPVRVDIQDWDTLTYYTNKNWGEINGFERGHSYTTTIDLNQDIEDIWNKINRQHKRHILRAEKNGINIIVSDKYKEFHLIYKRFLKQKNYIYPFGLNIFSSQFFQKYGLLFIAEYQGDILGGNYYFHDENNALSAKISYQLFENSIDKNKRIYDANCYLHWEAMQYFHNLGIKSYDLGRVNHFTQSFGGDVIIKYDYRKFNSRFNKLLFDLWKNQIYLRQKFSI